MKRHALALLACALLAGCFDSAPADGAYACAAPPTACPPGYVCAADQRCRRGGHDGGASSSCGDGLRDGDESDVDCGGSCAPCDVGRACAADADCRTTTCVATRCDLASGPPFWRPLPLLVRERVNPNVATLPDGRVVAIGGGDSANAISNTVEAYSPATSSWSALPPMVLARSGAAAGVVAGRLYVAGGLGNQNQLESYDAAQSAWSVVSNDIGFQIDQAGFVVAGEALVVFGGLSSPTTVGGEVHRYRPASGWTALSQLAPRRSLTGALGSDGLLYALGGNDGTRPLATVQSYSTVTGQWSDAPALPVATERLAAVAAPDGRIYVIGGATGASGAMPTGAAVATVEAYRPGSGGWTPVAPLQNPRRSLGATVGGDGLLYAVGGARDNAPALRDVEAYGPLAQLAAASVAPGGRPVVSGSNFAAHATVQLYASQSAGGAAIASGTTDGQGVLAPVTLPPFTTAGSYPLTLVDDRSRYPVTIWLTVGP